jgi:hypothetical protein
MFGVPGELLDSPECPHPEKLFFEVRMNPSAIPLPSGIGEGWTGLDPEESEFRWKSSPIYDCHG